MCLVAFCFLFNGATGQYDQSPFVILIYEDAWDSLNGGSALRKAFLLTQDNMSTKSAYMHALSGVQNHNPVSELNKKNILIPWNHCDRHMNGY